MVKNAVGIVFLCVAYVHIEAGSRSQMEDITQRVVMPLVKIATPVAAVASGIFSYTKINAVAVRIAELERSSAEVTAGRALYPYNGERVYSDEVFAQRMMGFLDACTPYPSQEVYAWSYQCMLVTCDLSFEAVAGTGAPPLLQPGDCCVVSKKNSYAYTVLGRHIEESHKAWLQHCAEAMLYFGCPERIIAEREYMELQKSRYTTQLYLTIAVSGVYAGFMLKSYFLDKK